MKKKDSTKDFINKDYIDKDGNAIVDVIINNPSELFSPYSNKMLLKREIFLFLDTIADPIPNDYPLIINFVLPDPTAVNQEYVREALRRYYWFSYKEMEKNLLKETITAILYLFIGVGILAIDAFINVNQSNPWLVVLSNLVLVISWALIWEAFSHLIIGRRLKVIDKNNEKQMATATIRFISKVGE